MNEKDLENIINSYYKENSKDDRNVPQPDISSFETGMNKMNIIENIASDLHLNIDINELVDKGMEIREKKLIKKSTILFICVSCAVTLLFATIYSQLSLKTVALTQVTLAIILLVIIYVLNTNQRKRELKR